MARSRVSILVITSVRQNASDNEGDNESKKESEKLG